MKLVLFASALLCLARAAWAVETVGPSIATPAPARPATPRPITLDAAKELPRYPPVEPQDAVATWRVKRGFALELAAHEPQVRSPIALCFDERGRMFVCEMVDYPEQRETAPHLGRISVLEDKDGDGRYETSTVFADDLPWPTGIIWANGGLYVIATPDIWFFQDTKGTGRADRREKVFTGFGTGLQKLNVQGLANSPQWGQDHRIHVLAGGGNRGVVTCLRRPDLPGVELGGQDFWFDPRTLEFGLEPGGAQYGMSFDDYGRKFGCANSDHLQFWAYSALPAGVHAPKDLPPARQSIAADGGAAEVYRISPDEPWRIVRTRWRIAGTAPGIVEGGGRVSGYFTGASGTTIYRGDALGPDFLNNSFTGDAGGQLVHRKIIRDAADGVNLVGERPPDEHGFEFAASRDTWVRVVDFANAPDGCLYICDMYREVIEHPWSIPEEIKQHLDLKSGSDRGRIYRLAPTGWRSPHERRRRGDLSDCGTAELVQFLGDANGWHRDTAQRLLYERQDSGSAPLLEELCARGSAVAKLHALGALDGMGALRAATLRATVEDRSPMVRGRALQLATARQEDGELWTELEQKALALCADPDPRVRFQLALALAARLGHADRPVLREALRRLALQDHGHPWIGPALLCGPPAIVTATLFEAMTSDPNLARQAQAFIARLIELRAATQGARDRLALISFLAQAEPNPVWLRALGTGLQRAGVSLEAADEEGLLAGVFQQAAQRAADPSVREVARLSGLALLPLAPARIARPALAACLQADQTEEIQAAAVSALAEDAAPEATTLLLQSWHGLAPKSRALDLEALLARKERARALLQAIRAGAFPGAALSAAQLQRLLHDKDPSIAASANEVLKPFVPPSRAEVAAKFREAAAMPGDAARGQTQFRQRCLTCHRAAGDGFQVGPDLVTVKNKGREALLTAIVEPSKEVATQYILYHVATKDGRSFSGIVIDDNAAGTTLKLPGGATETIARGEILSTTSEGQSLMPDGLEAGMTVQDMADLLSFIEALP